MSGLNHTYVHRSHHLQVSSIPEGLGLAVLSAHPIVFGRSITCINALLCVASCCLLNSDSVASQCLNIQKVVSCVSKLDARFPALSLGNLGLGTRRCRTLPAIHSHPNDLLASSCVCQAGIGVGTRYRLAPRQDDLRYAEKRCHNCKCGGKGSTIHNHPR